MSNRQQLKQALSTSVLASRSLQPSAVSLRDRSRGGGEQAQHMYECRARDSRRLCQLFASYPALFSACPCLLNNAAPLQICSQPHPPPFYLAVIPANLGRSVSTPGLDLQQNHCGSLRNQDNCPGNLLERGGPGVSDSSRALHGGWQLCLVIGTD